MNDLSKAFEAFKREIDGIKNQAEQLKVGQKINHSILITTSMSVAYLVDIYW